MASSARRNRTAWIALLGVALAVRVAVVVALVPNAPDDGSHAQLTYEHGVIAKNLLEGRGFSVWYLGSEGPTSQQAPWVPLILAGCYAIFGIGSTAAIVAYQLLQSAAGVGLVAAAVRLGWNLFPERREIGWATGWAAALFPTLVYMVTHVQAAPWTALGVTALLAVACRPAAHVTWRRTSLMGALSGWLLLVDPIVVVVLPIVALRVFLTERGNLRTALLRTALLRTTAVAAVALLTVSPWLVRNYRVHGEFVFIKSSFGYALWQGNNALSWGTDKIPKASAAEIAASHDGSLASRNAALWEARHETIYIDDVLLKPNGYREFQGLSEPARSRVLGARAQEWIASHPLDYARLCGRRLRYFLLWDETNPKAMNAVYQAASIVWLTLSLLGLAAARRQCRNLWPTIGTFIAIAAFHALTITSARFRIPVEPFGLLWAAAGLMPAVAPFAERIGAAARFSRQWSAGGKTMSHAGSTTDN